MPGAGLAWAPGRGVRTASWNSSLVSGDLAAPGAAGDLAGSGGLP